MYIQRSVSVEWSLVVVEFQNDTFICIEIEHDFYYTKTIGKSIVL